MLLSLFIYPTFPLSYSPALPLVCLAGWFFTQKDVKRHTVVHTGSRNFQCPFCSHRFGRKDHLVRHTKKTHNQDTRSSKRRDDDQAANDPPAVFSRIKKRRPRKTKKQLEGEQEQQPSGSLLTLSASTYSVSPNSNLAASNPMLSASLSTTNFVGPNGEMYLSGSSHHLTPTVTTSYECYNNSVIMLSSSSLPKMSLADNNNPTHLHALPSRPFAPTLGVNQSIVDTGSLATSLSLTASLANRQYANSMDSYVNSPGPFNTFGQVSSIHHQQPQFLSTSGGTRLFPSLYYYDESYKLTPNGSGNPPSCALYPTHPVPTTQHQSSSDSMLFSQQQQSMTQPISSLSPSITNNNSSSIAITSPNGDNNSLSIKTISSSIVHGVNTCIELDRIDLNNLPSSSGSYGINDPWPCVATTPPTNFNPTTQPRFFSPP